MQFSDFKSVFPALSSRWNKNQTFIIQAPTGLGKSTCIPAYISEKILQPKAMVVCLEPRRIAVVGLAHRVAEQKNEPVGASVGFRVRGHSRFSPQTTLCYQTYGWFLRYAVRNPELPGIRAVVFDEFHERSLEIDLALAYIRHLILNKQKSIKLIIMSATLDLDQLMAYCPNPGKFVVHATGFPVQVMHMDSIPGEPLWEHVFRAVRKMLSDISNGTILIFLPGLFEIQKTEQRLSDFCDEYDIKLNTLFGAQTLNAQRAVLSSSSVHRLRIVLSTNIAESALTIPGVRAVIDSGWVKISEFDEFRGINILKVRKCAIFNIVQRQGRAGRTGPGAAVRLWNKTWERSLPGQFMPEILRLELSQLQLLSFHLLGQYEKIPSTIAKDFWLTPPDKARWAYAFKLLKKIKCISTDGRLLPIADEIAQLPLNPLLGWLFLKGKALKYPHVSAAMVSIIQEGHAFKNLTGNLFKIATQFLEDPHSFPGALSTTYHQVCKSIPGKSDEFESPGKFPRKLMEFWHEACGHQFASKTGETENYQLSDGRKAYVNNTSPGSPHPSIILPIAFHERKSASQKSLNIQLWLPISSQWFIGYYSDNIHHKRVFVWNEKLKKVELYEESYYKSLTIQRSRMSISSQDRKHSGDLLTEQVIKNPGWLPLSPEADRLVVRIKLLGTAYPQFNMPNFDEEDWMLIIGECCHQKIAVKEISSSQVLATIKSYAGNMAVEWLKTALPLKIRLQSGKIGKYCYAKEEAPELSARIGDFIGMQGEHFLCEGKIKVRYNILAPNFRTVQKTWDLTGFWTNTYPEVKKELKRRYPKHPWP